jgi:hypothetical protein
MEQLRIPSPTSHPGAWLASKTIDPYSTIMKLTRISPNRYGDSKGNRRRSTSLSTEQFGKQSFICGNMKSIYSSHILFWMTKTSFENAILWNWGEVVVAPIISSSFGTESRNTIL